MTLTLTKLTAEYPVHAFTCGSRPGAAEIDDYLKTSAPLERESGLSVVWVVIDTALTQAEDAIVGFFTLSPLGVRSIRSSRPLSACRTSAIRQWEGGSSGASAWP